LFARPRRLLTSCAHRLGKPHRTIVPLTPSVTRRRGITSAPRSILRLPRESCPSRFHPPRQARRCLGLFKASATPEPGRLPSARSSCLAAEAGLHALTVRLPALAPHPLTHCESAFLVKDGRRVRLPRDDSAHLSVRSALPGKMRLSDFCNQHTTRAPYETLDSRITPTPGFRPG
jgi:hypothetical protein